MEDKPSGHRGPLVKQLVKTAAGTYTFLAKTFSLLANIAVVAGIWFAVSQIRQTEKIEKRRVAIEAVNQARSAEFLKAYRQLKSACREDISRVEKSEKATLVDSLNHTMNVYDHLARMYLSDVADKCVIIDGVFLGIQEMPSICKCTDSCPLEFRTKLDEFIMHMREEPCAKPLITITQHP
jgi:hypothetical protein